MPYSFSRVLVWDNSAGVVRLARNVDVRVLDPTTGQTAPGLAVDGTPAQTVRSDHTGRIDFTAAIGTVLIVPPAGIPVEQTSLDMLAEASQAAARAEAAEASAAASAALVGAPAKSAMDAAMGGDVAGLVPAVTALGPAVAGKVGKGELMISVRDHGAKGDGIADDSAALQAAANAAIGKTLLIDPGHYLLNTQVYLSSNTRVIGYGATVHRGPLLTKVPLCNYAPGDTTTTAFNGNSNITIEGLTIDSHGDDPGRPASNGLTFAHAANITVRDVTILRVKGSHHLEFAAVDGALVENCRLLGWTTDPGLTKREALQIDCADDNIGSGAKDGTMSKNITIRDCRTGPYGAMGAPQIGVASHTVVTGKMYENIQVERFTAEGCTYAAVRGYYWRDSVISGVRASMDAGASYGVYVEYSADTVISKVVAGFPSTAGVTVAVERSDNVTVNGCKATGGRHSYSVNTSRATTVTGCTARRPNVFGIVVDGATDTLITSTLIDGAGYPAGESGAIRVTTAAGISTRTSITGNRALAHGAGTEVSVGVSVAAGAVDTWVFGNDFKGLPAATSGPVNTTSNRI